MYGQHYDGVHGGRHRAECVAYEVRGRSSALPACICRRPAWDVPENGGMAEDGEGAQHSDAASVLSRCTLVCNLLHANESIDAASAHCTLCHLKLGLHPIAESLYHGPCYAIVPAETLQKLKFGLSTPLKIKLVANTLLTHVAGFHCRRYR
jgi:hypothetical protein